MSNLDRLKIEIAIFEKLLFAVLATLLAIIGWSATHYGTMASLLVFGVLIAVVINAGVLVFVYRRIKYCLEKSKNVKRNHGGSDDCSSDRCFRCLCVGCV